MIEILMEKLHLNKEDVMADIGSGTGLSSKPFLENNFKVFAVEPNEEMREAAETLFKNNRNFVSVNGTSEHTQLDNESIDVIFCGQAFHWFDLEKTKPEFQRILKPGGNIVLAWNERDTASPLQNDYENILDRSIEE